VAIVVGGLILIISIVVVCAVVSVVRFRRYSQRQRTEAAMIQMFPTAFSNSYSNDAFDDFQQPCASVAGAVDGVDSE